MAAVRTPGSAAGPGITVGGDRNPAPGGDGPGPPRTGGGRLKRGPRVVQSACLLRAIIAAGSRTCFQNRADGPGQRDQENPACRHAASELMTESGAPLPRAGG